MRNSAFTHLSPAPLVRRYGPRLRPYDTSSSICGHSKPDRAAQKSRIGDVYDEGEQCFAGSNRQLVRPCVACGNVRPLARRSRRSVHKLPHPEGATDPACGAGSAIRRRIALDARGPGPARCAMPRRLPASPDPPVADHRDRRARDCQFL
ncbi:hypothetical protein C7H84_01915 [Burkholderia sp. Nafp2/4-1b]|nr:hypothetical protein C7H84_01915 [Burkholderia sp. Nafp2/4-1b]